MRVPTAVPDDRASRQASQAIMHSSWFMSFGHFSAQLWPPELLLSSSELEQAANIPMNRNSAKRLSNPFPNRIISSLPMNVLRVIFRSAFITNYLRKACVVSLLSARFAIVSRRCRLNHPRPQPQPKLAAVTNIASYDAVFAIEHVIGRIGLDLPLSGDVCIPQARRLR